MWQPGEGHWRGDPGASVPVEVLGLMRRLPEPLCVQTAGPRLNRAGSEALPVESVISKITKEGVKDCSHQGPRVPAPTHLSAVLRVPRTPFLQGLCPTPCGGLPLRGSGWRGQDPRLRGVGRRDADVDPRLRGLPGLAYF